MLQEFAFFVLQDWQTQTDYPNSVLGCVHGEVITQKYAQVNGALLGNHRSDSPKTPLRTVFAGAATEVCCPCVAMMDEDGAYMWKEQRGSMPPVGPRKSSLLGVAMMG